MTTPLLTATGLHRRYGHSTNGFEAVRGIDLHVDPGEIFALLGTNGAGKTSTMELLEGMARPSAGTVRIAGLDPFTERRRLRPHLGIVLQNAGFSGDLTVAETARMWAGTMTAPRPIDEALALVDMFDRRAVLVQSLSGGERRRLDLALAIMGRPRLLFLDEPTTGLDPESRHRAWDVLARLVDGGTSVVLTTHYLEEAERLADRIAIMHAGQIATTGTLAQIVADQPATITFRTPAVSVPQFAGVHMSVDGPRTVLHTHNLQPDLARLLAWAGEDIVLEDLRANAASLEQTFLTIAGSTSSPHHEAAA
ncbi:ABC transporter ATP-binding protein [Dermatophilus congolensis]|uniref:ABC transporter ATP-binding protein n=1 Tax=Dermatophilus congolensis TaxID=1863 RepID=UPI001AAEC8B2|nr:ABC transporter ATP-binding protein [Dermatophilus congolensis]MBO3143628.1 ABC transporter ATP-binding protein [Dermatophilus congolensis]MBO3152620.1 ABC transporter ATP-binding protein [Dermatophilus congolensis]MBO3160368.1 ABC transporter ATP-binding protein [Dermatophilus congolensis]MBO3163905.1 ABC transporter ATP-binding protein [Dermatophilus congolensis]MBO3177451.1 ABC transporter ATP-binding protein [Dermatophilus congolensis]